MDRQGLPRRDLWKWSLWGQQDFGGTANSGDGWTNTAPPQCREQPPAASSQVRFIPQEGQDPSGPNPSSGGHQQQTFCRPSCQEGACWGDSK